MLVSSAMRMATSVSAAASHARLQHGPGSSMVKTGVALPSNHILIITSIQHSCSAMLSMCFAQSTLYSTSGAPVYFCGGLLQKIGLWLVAALVWWVLAAAGSGHGVSPLKSALFADSLHWVP